MAPRGVPACTELAEVLTWGQLYANTTCGDGALTMTGEAERSAGTVLADAVASCTEGGAEPCECVVLERGAHCSHNRLVNITLGRIAAANALRHVSKCHWDHDCNAPQGQCVAGRCQCNLNWGRWDCSANNSRLEQQQPDSHFRPALWERHYLHGGTNPENIRTAADALRELPWGMLQSKSGGGSSEAATSGLRCALPRIIRLFGIHSIVDVPCGDFNYMRQVLSSPVLAGHRLSYTGMDIVQPLVDGLQRAFGTPNDGMTSRKVRFQRFDLSLQQLWPADLVVMRDVLFHFSKERILEVLARVNASGSRYFLSTYFPNSNNTQLGDLHKKYGDGGGHYSFWPVDLVHAPFSLGPPLLTIGRDGDWWWKLQKYGAAGTRQRLMGLWRLPLY